LSGFEDDPLINKSPGSLQGEDQLHSQKGKRRWAQLGANNWAPLAENRWEIV